MPIRFFTYCILGLIMLLANSCQNVIIPNDTPRLFTEYYVRYLESERQLKAYASFFEGDSLSNALPKTFLGGVSFQGSAMEARSIMDKTTRYTITITADYSDAFRFKFKDDQRKEHTHAVSMTPIKNFVVAPQINKSEGLTLTVEGGELSSNESLVLLFNDESNKASSITINGPSQGITHEIPAANLKGLSEGKYQLYLVKKKQEVSESSDQYISSAIEYYSATKEIEVLD